MHRRPNRQFRSSRSEIVGSVYKPSRTDAPSSSQHVIQYNMADLIPRMRLYTLIKKKVITAYNVVLDKQGKPKEIREPGILPQLNVELQNSAAWTKQPCLQASHENAGTAFGSSLVNADLHALQMYYERKGYKNAYANYDIHLGKRAANLLYRMCDSTEALKTMVDASQPPEKKKLIIQKVGNTIIMERDGYGEGKTPVTKVLDDFIKRMAIYPPEMMTDRDRTISNELFECGLGLMRLLVRNDIHAVKYPNNGRMPCTDADALVPWTMLRDEEKSPNNGIKVSSTFACMARLCREGMYSPYELTTCSKYVHEKRIKEEGDSFFGRVKEIVQCEAFDMVKGIYGKTCSKTLSRMHELMQRVLSDQTGTLFELHLTHLTATLYTTSTSNKLVTDDNLIQYFHAETEPSVSAFVSASTNPDAVSRRLARITVM